MFLVVSAERVTMDLTDLTDDVPVNVVGVPTCWVIGYHPESGVGIER